MDTSTTVLNAKAAFILHQVRLLSQPLQPSTTWASFAPTSTTTTATQPSPKAVATALTRLNDKLKQHNKNVYSAPSQRHVAEQLDALYWNQVLEDEATAAAHGANTDANALAVSRDADLTSLEVVEGLPEELDELQIHPTPSSREDINITTRRYAELRKRLNSAVRTRDAQRKRLEGYRRLRRVLEPLEEPQENVQPNLVTRDGELARELDRMRVLCARLAAGVVEEAQQGEEKKSLGEAVGERERLQAALDLT